MTHSLSPERTAFQQFLDNPKPYLKAAAVIIAVTLFWSDQQVMKRDIADIKAYLRAPHSSVVVEAPQEGPLTMLKHE